MNSKYGVFNFHEYPNRIDVKMIDYNKSERKKYHAKHSLVKMSKVMEEVKSPAVFEDGLTYKYYDTSIESVTEKGEFKNYKLISKQNKPSRAKQKAIKDTIIVANLKTNKSKATIVTENEDGSIVSSGYLMIKPKGNIDIEYLKTVFHSPQIIYYLRQICSTGLGMANWSFNDLANVKIPLPPIEEQRRTLPIVKEKIAGLEEKIKELEKEKEKNSLQNIIDRVFEEELNMVNHKFDKKIIYDYYDFNNMNERLDLRSQIFIKYVKHDIPYAVKIKKIAKINSQAVIRRRTHINGKLIEFKDIVPFAGKILNYRDVDEKFGSEVTKFKGNDIMFSKMNPQSGNMVLVTPEHDDFYGSAEFWGLVIDKDICIPEYFLFALGLSSITNNYKYWLTGAQGSSDNKKGGRARISDKEFFNMNIPLPNKNIQRVIIDKINSLHDKYSNIYFDNKIKSINKCIERDLNRYILEGYSDDLFEINEEDYLE